MPKHEKRISLRSIPPEIKYNIASYLHLSSVHTQISITSRSDGGFKIAIEAAKWDQFNPSYFILDQDIFDEFIREGHKHTRCLELDHTSAITSEVQGLYLPKLRSIRIMPGFTQYEELALLTEKNPQIMCLEFCNESYIQCRETLSMFTNEPILASMATPSLSVLRIDQELDHNSLGLILGHFTNLHDITFFLSPGSVEYFYKSGSRGLSFSSNIQYIKSDRRFFNINVRSIFSNPKNFPKLESISIQDEHFQELVPLFNRMRLGPNHVSKSLERLLSDEDLALVNPEVYQARWIIEHRKNSRTLKVLLYDFKIASSECLEALSILATGLRDLEYVRVGFHDMGLYQAVSKDVSKRLFDAILSPSYNFQQNNSNQRDIESIPKQQINQNHLQNLNALILGAMTLTLSDFTLFNQCPKLSNISVGCLDIDELPFILSEGIAFPYIERLQALRPFNLSNDFIQVLSLFPHLVNFGYYRFTKKIGIVTSKLKNPFINAAMSIVSTGLCLRIQDVYEISIFYSKPQTIPLHWIKYDIEKLFIKDTTTTMMFSHLKTLDIDGLKEFKSVKDTIKLLDTFPALEVFKFCSNYVGSVDSLCHMAVPSQHSANLVQPTSKHKIMKFECYFRPGSSLPIEPLLCLCQYFKVEELNIYIFGQSKAHSSPPSLFPIPSVTKIRIFYLKSDEKAWLIKFLLLFPNLKAVEIGCAWEVKENNAIWSLKTEDFSFTRLLKLQFKQDPELLYRLKKLVSKEMFDYYDLKAIDNQVQDELFSVYYSLCSQISARFKQI